MIALVCKLPSQLNCGSLSQDPHLQDQVNVSLDLDMDRQALLPQQKGLKYFLSPERPDKVGKGLRQTHPQFAKL